MQDHNMVIRCGPIDVGRTFIRPSGLKSGSLRVCDRRKLLRLAPIAAALLISFVAASAYFRNEDAGRTGIKAFGAHALDNALDDLRSRYRFDSVRGIDW
jgi:hypothetical protein